MLIASSLYMGCLCFLMRRMVEVVSRGKPNSIKYIGTEPCAPTSMPRARSMVMPSQPPTRCGARLRRPSTCAPSPLHLREKIDQIRSRTETWSLCLQNMINYTCPCFPRTRRRWWVLTGRNADWGKPKAKAMSKSSTYTGGPATQPQ